LKQLQLIQILSIKARRPAAAGNGAARVPRVNRKSRAPNMQKAVSAIAETASKRQKRGICAVLRFTAR
jgi:hypothetical protein